MFSLHKLKFEKIQKKIATTNLDVIVSTVNYIAPTKLETILSEAKSKNRNVIFTHIPGPLPEGSKVKYSREKYRMMTGCDKQLKELNDQANALNADIYVVNKMPSKDQAGAHGLLTKWNLPNLFMISDSGAWEKTFNLSTIKVGHEKYLKNFSLLVTPDKHTHAFTIANPITDEVAKNHVQNIQDHIDALHIIKEHQHSVKM